jgi:hypothetical protein
LAVGAAVVLPASAYGIYETVKPVSALDAAKMFPQETTDLRTFTPENISTLPNPAVMEKLQAYGVDKDGKDDPSTPQSAYFDSFLTDAKTFNDFRQTRPWMGVSFAEGTWKDGAATIYSLENTGDAKKFLESEECKSSFLKDNCGEGKYVIKNRWLVTGSKDSLSLYNEDFDSSLADNPKFAVQTANVLGQSFASAWTPSENITAFLPHSLNKSLPSKAQAAVALHPTEKGIRVSGSIFRGDSENDMFSKEPISNSITQTPGNTVMAISVSSVNQDVLKMTQDPEAFINKSPEWTGFRKGLETYGAKVPDDLEGMLGKTTTFSLNEGTVGNKVAGTIKVDKGNPAKASSILGNAAAKNPDIKDMYKMKESEGNFLIESHSPITEGMLSANPLFNQTVGDISNSVAVAYIDFDASRSLLDSTYIKPESSYDKGVMGINFFKKDAGELGFTVNWEMIK